MKTNVQYKVSTDEVEAMRRVARDQTNTLATRDTQQVRSLRLLWRIYTLAFAAAERQEQAHQPVQQDSSCPQ